MIETVIDYLIFLVPVVGFIGVVGLMSICIGFISGRK